MINKIKKHISSFLKLWLILVNESLNQPGCVKEVCLGACKWLHGAYIEFALGKWTHAFSEVNIIFTLLCSVSGKLYIFFSWNYFIKLGPATQKPSEPDNQCEEKPPYQREALRWTSSPLQPWPVSMPCVPERAVKKGRGGTHVDRLQ